MKDGKAKCEWYIGEDWHGTEYDPLDYLPNDRAVWQRAALAAHVLHRTDTKASRDALARLADGHKKANPTRTAAELLKAKVPAPAAEFTSTGMPCWASNGPIWCRPSWWRPCSPSARRRTSRAF
jgi:hypothetical protein